MQVANNQCIVVIFTQIRMLVTIISIAVNANVLTSIAQFMYRLSNKLTMMAVGEVELIEHSVRFPPPMVLGLGEHGLAIMSVNIGMVSAVAVPNYRSSLLNFLFDYIRSMF